MAALRCFRSAASECGLNPCADDTHGGNDAQDRQCEQLFGCDCEHAVPFWPILLEAKQAWRHDGMTASGLKAATGVS